MFTILLYFINWYSHLLTLFFNPAFCFSSSTILLSRSAIFSFVSTSFTAKTEKNWEKQVLICKGVMTSVQTVWNSFHTKLTISHPKRQAVNSRFCPSLTFYIYWTRKFTMVYIVHYSNLTSYPMRSVKNQVNILTARWSLERTRHSLYSSNVYM